MGPNLPRVPVLRTLLTILGAGVLLGAIVLSVWSYDVYRDRKHRLTINSPVPVYAAAGNEACGGTRIAVVEPGTALKIRRIRYWKNCATLDVVLPDGRVGHVVPSASELTIDPPLE
jgi:hypothetical protein